MSSEAVVSWFFRISLAVAFTVSLYVIYKNHRNHKQATQNEKGSIPKWLNIWSTLTLYSVPLSCLIFISCKVPFICIQTCRLGAWSYSTPKILLGYYQISRLHYCFSKKQIHSKLGYPTCLFIILFLIGWANNLHAIIYPFIYMNPYEKPNNLGCDWDQDEVTKNSFIATTVYSVWDLFTLSLYIYKIHGATKVIQIKQKEQETQNKILKRIKNIMAKIVFLTVIYEIITTVMVNLFFWGLASSPVVALGWAIDFLMGSYIIYLMLEHNSKSYMALLKFMNNTGMFTFCCCCFRSLMKEAIEQAMMDLVTNGKSTDNNNNNNGNKKGEKVKKVITPPTIDTGTLGVVSRKDLYEERTINHSVETSLEIVCEQDK